MQISVNLHSGRFEKKSPGGDFCMQISVNLHSGRFEKKSLGGISAYRFQESAELQMRKITKPGGGEFLHADFSKSARFEQIFSVRVIAE